MVAFTGVRILVSGTAISLFRNQKWRGFEQVICFLAPHKGVRSNRQSGIPIGSMYGIFTYIWWIFMVNVGKYTIHGSSGYDFIDQFCTRYQTLSWLIVHDKAPFDVFELSLFGWCETTPGYLCGWSCQWWNQPRQQSSHEQIHDAVRWRCTRGEISSNDLFIWLESCERRLSTCRVIWMRSPSCWFVFPWEKK